MLKLQEDELPGAIATENGFPDMHTIPILSPCYRAWLACSRRKSGTLHVNEDQ